MHQSLTAALITALSQPHPPGSVPLQLSILIIPILAQHSRAVMNVFSPDLQLGLKHLASPAQESPELPRLIIILPGSAG